MSEQPKQEWRIHIAKSGATCQIWLNGQAIHPYMVHVRMAVGLPSMVSMQFPIYGRSGQAYHEDPIYQEGDPLVMEGTPRETILTIDGRRFRVLELLKEGAQVHGA